MGLTLVKADEKADTLADVLVPDKYYNRVKTGIKVVDALFGDVTAGMEGLLLGSCTMVTGVPGAGKTTMMLQLGDSLATHTGRQLLYNANEESKPMIKMAADRIKVRGDFQLSQKHSVDELIAYVQEQGYEILIQDSLQTLADGTLSGQRLLKSVCRKLVRLAHDNDIVVLFVGQVTKGGEMAGPMALKHEVDAHMHLGVDRETGNRVLCMEKNRFGPAMVPYEFSLSAHGLEFRQAERPPEGSVSSGHGTATPPSRQVERRKEVQAFIRERLEAGDLVSGYCFERYGVDCSGGYWRGMCRLVIEQLKREGFEVGECRVDGRLHNFIIKPGGKGIAEA